MNGNESSCETTNLRSSPFSNPNASLVKATLNGSDGNGYVSVLTFHGRDFTNRALVYQSFLVSAAYYVMLRTSLIGFSSVITVRLVLSPEILETIS